MACTKQTIHWSSVNLQRMKMQNKEEHKNKSVRNRSKGSARLHSSISSSNSISSSIISDDKHSQQEDKKLKQSRNNQKMIL
eukprot:9189778-Ditylum_brightwellii.AAC.1